MFASVYSSSQLRTFYRLKLNTLILHHIKFTAKLTLRVKAKYSLD